MDYQGSDQTVKAVMLSIQFHKNTTSTITSAAHTAYCACTRERQKDTASSANAELSYVYYINTVHSQRVTY